MANVIVFYVGGGCDGYCGKDYVIVKRYAHLHHGRFFMHFEDRTLKAAMIEAKAQGDAIVLIGHSWGGDAVIDLMLERDTPRPDLIVTVDPVGRSTTFGLHGGNRFGGLWVNITAVDDDKSKSGGNYVAQIWGRTSGKVTRHADVQIDSPHVHEDFAEILRYSRVPEMIETIRANAANRQR